MWLRLVGRGQDLGLVDVVDAERLEHLRLDEVADARLGHHRDGHRVHDPLDHRRVAHARDAARRADVGRDALERHHGDGAGILGDLGVLGRDDVHDDAALEHLGQALLGGPGGRFDGHVGWIPLVLALGSPAGSGPGVLARSSRPSPARVPIIARAPESAASSSARAASTSARFRQSVSKRKRVASSGYVDQANARAGRSSHRPPSVQLPALAS